MRNTSATSTITLMASTIAIHWFKERSRQAKISFNIAVGLAAATTVLSVATAISVCTGKISEATGAAGLGLTSGAVSAYCFKLSDDANKRLDAAAKELLDDE
jgi:predicted hotdog family 3-hydroxylacyl-ACP dehydratase